MKLFKKTGKAEGNAVEQVLEFENGDIAPFRIIEAQGKTFSLSVYGHDEYLRCFLSGIDKAQLLQLYSECKRSLDIIGLE